VRKLLVSLVCMLTIGAALDAGAAQARLDRSFGQNGVVEVRPPLPAPWRDQYIRRLAAARDGSSFALFERQYCAGQAGCVRVNSLFRYLPDGSLDPAFGGLGGSYELPPEGEGIPALAVDSRGRPLLAQAGGGRVVIRRLTPSGTPDPSFGSNGAAAYGCQCDYGAAQLIPGPAGTVTVVLPHPQMTGTAFTLLRLKTNGSLNARFGDAGSAAFGLRGADTFVGAATAIGGAIYLSGGSCCGPGIPGYVSRVSASGKFDRRFTAAAQQSLLALQRIATLEVSVDAVIVRPGGKIDLLGSAGYEKGFVMRLKPNGKPNRKFGKNGLRLLPVAVVSAALDSHGTTLAIGNENLGGDYVLMRILPGGRLDLVSGRIGERIPGNGGGVSVVPQSGRKALVLNLGLMECRGACPAEPRLVRFLVGPAKRR
jgi:hypothetical protein